jgi:hypothetical protein
LGEREFGTGVLAQGGLHPKACRWWSQDLYGFNKRIEHAHADYVEFLEPRMQQILDEKPHNHDILRIFQLKEEVKVINTGSPIRMLEKLKELAMRVAERERRELEGRIVEGEFKELPGGHDQL